MMPPVWYSGYSRNVRGTEIMRIDKLTSKLQSALADAQSIAVGKDHNFIEPVHLMQALLDQQGGSVKPLLQQVGAEAGRVREAVAQEIENQPEVQGRSCDVSVSNELGQLLEMAGAHGQKRCGQFVTTELIMLEPPEDRYSLGRILREQCVNKAALEKAINRVRGCETMNITWSIDNRQ